MQSDDGPAIIANTMDLDALESMFEEIRRLNPNTPDVKVKVRELWQLEIAELRSVPCLFADVQAGAECATGMVNLMCGKLGIGLSDESFQKFRGDIQAGVEARDEGMVAKLTCLWKRTNLIMEALTSGSRHPCMQHMWAVAATTIVHLRHHRCKA